MPHNMANNSVPASDSLIDIPDDISVKFLPNSRNLSDKVLQKGLNYFTQGYIHDIKIYNQESSLQIAARCWRSMRKNQSPHQLSIEIKDSCITESHCSCKVGYVNWIKKTLENNFIEEFVVLVVSSAFIVLGYYVIKPFVYCTRIPLLVRDYDRCHTYFFLFFFLYFLFLFFIDSKVNVVKHT